MKVHSKKKSLKLSIYSRQFFLRYWRIKFPLDLNLIFDLDPVRPSQSVSALEVNNDHYKKI